MSDTQPNELSERELEILKLVATGASNKEIAQKLFISANTVKVHLRNIFAKIGAVSRTEAAMHAVRIGLVASPAARIDVEPAPAPFSGDGAAAAGEVSQPGEAEASRRTRRLRTAGVVALVVVVVTLVEAGGVWLGGRSLFAAPVGPTPTAESRWRVLADMPTARQGMAAAAYENQVYTIGGETAQGVVTNTLERYDPATDTWNRRSAKPLPAADVNAAALGGLIYVPGGRLPSGLPTDVMEVYDPRQDRWEQRASLPVALSGYALATFEGRLYVFGGWDGHTYLDTVYAYDPSRDQWETLTAMPTARAFAGAASAANRIYVMGGYDGERALAVNEAYSPHLEGVENPWDQAEPMPASRYAIGIASVADSIYVLGGKGEESGLASSLVYLAQTDEWRAFETPPVNPGGAVGLASLGEYLYAIGEYAEGGFSGYTLAYRAFFTVMIPIIR